jgi:hypothetical protein
VCVCVSVLNHVMFFYSLEDLGMEKCENLNERN